ncbi:NADP-dependent dehydrogenase-like protein [Echria macrotheca]|uniref:NADP-dependent dehydrogenase-like protein n=1 Tax=Echria macrotheca TaxID=438768 RepID=A0AAJ0B1S1_9PEZI|nr:NADP-dependent dehydrogenase-like protein [Echria macrotheca]
MPVFVITGARGGIGLGYVSQLAQDSNSTVFALVRDLKGDISALESIKTNGPGTVHILECDISSEPSIEKLPDQIRSLQPDASIDVLINNAAVLHSRHEDSLNLTTDTLVSHITSNVMGPAKILQALLPLLSPSARIANITSGLGSLAMLLDGRINAELTPYSISKTAVNMLTVHQAKHLAKRGLKDMAIICVDPGHVKTEMGGPNAVVEIADSASGVLATLRKLKPEDSGKFYLYNGTELPW